MSQVHPLQSLDSITAVAVIGAGELGMCIAIDLALCGVQVNLFDQNESALLSLHQKAFEKIQPLTRLNYLPDDALAKATNNIRAHTSLKDAVENVQAIFESVSDNVAVKRDVLSQVEMFCPPTAIISTNSLNIAVDTIANNLSRPQLFLGIRFLYPCLLISAVEITPGTNSQPEALKRICSFLNSIGKVTFKGPSSVRLSRSNAVRLQESASQRLGYSSGGLVDLANGNHGSNVFQLLRVAPYIPPEVTAMSSLAGNATAGNLMSPD